MKVIKLSGYIGVAKIEKNLSWKIHADIGGHLSVGVHQVMETET